MEQITEHHATARMDYSCNGILIVTLNDHTELSLQDIIEHREIAARLTQNKPHCVMAIAGEGTQTSEEARLFAAANIPAGRIAEAVVMKSVTIRIIGNFYLKFQKPGLPTKLFDDRYEAMHWLEMQMKLSGNKKPE